MTAAREQFRLRRQLLLHVKRCATKQGIGLTAPCEHRFEMMINNGVQRMANERAVEDLARVQLASENLRRCIKMLSEISAGSGKYPLGEAEMLDEAMQRMSPLWPFG